VPKMTAERNGGAEAFALGVGSGGKEGGGAIVPL
jgi:hypothetical protein